MDDNDIKILKTLRDKAVSEQEYRIAGFILDIENEIKGKRTMYTSSFDILNWWNNLVVQCKTKYRELYTNKKYNFHVTRDEITIIYYKVH